MKKYLSIFIVLIFIFSASAVFAEKKEAGVEVPKEKTIIQGWAHTIRTMDPAKTIGLQARSITNSVYDTLVTYNKDNANKPIPNLAESYEISDKGQVWTFHLRKGVKFTTGNEVTAEDIVYSFKRGFEINSPTYPKAILQLIDPETSFEIIDDYTLKIKLRIPTVGFIRLCESSSTAVVDKDTLEKHKTNDDPYGSNWLNEHSIGSGPFILDEWERDDRIVLKKNPNYWGIAAHFHRVPGYDKLIIKNITEPSALKMMIEKGDIDFTLELTRDIIDKYEENPVENIEIFEFPNYRGTAIYMNPAYAPIADTNVIKAIKAAIDYPTLINELLYAIRLDRPIFKPAVGTDDELLYDYNVAKAKEYMAKSKYPDGFPLTLTIGTGVICGCPNDTIALKIQKDLSKIGIDVKIEQYDWSVMDEKLFSGKYQAELGKYPSFFGDTEGMVSVIGRSNGPLWKGNAWSASDTAAECDKLFNLAMEEPNLDKRYKLYRKASELFAEKAPIVFIGQQISKLVHRSDIGGFNGNPDLSAFEFATLYKK